MMEATAVSSRMPGQAAQPPRARHQLTTRLARSLVFGQLSGLRHGRLVIVDGDEHHVFGSGEASISATVVIHDARMYRRMVLGGSVAVAEAFMDGMWTCEHLTDLIRIFCMNNDVQSGLERGWARLTRPWKMLAHWRNANTRHGSRRNIAAHYDLGNDFFELFLDETMMYSCAVFPHESSTLHDASVNKNDRICRKLELKPTDHLLEIGTGWGGFAIHAAREYGCRVTTTTISPRQLDRATQRVREAGLVDRVTVLRQDYRELQGSFDKLVSIEMMEAIGHRYFDTYFRRCAQLLKPDGMMLLQTITIGDRWYADYKKNVDFIQKFIFPGGCLPSVTAICQSLTRASDLSLYHLEDLAPHYARTLACWRSRFFDRVEDVRRLGYPERFIRMWEFYLCYCEGAFRERTTGVVQALLTKPFCRRPSLVPPLASPCPAV